MTLSILPMMPMLPMLPMMPMMPMLPMLLMPVPLNLPVFPRFLFGLDQQFFFQELPKMVGWLVVVGGGGRQHQEDRLNFFE